MTEPVDNASEKNRIQPEGIEAVLEQISLWSRQDLDYELRKFKGIRAWALKKSGIDYVVGDKVQIKDGYSVTKRLSDGHANGWWPSRECLVPGAVATVKKIDFNAAYSYWYADITLDREWTVGSLGKDVKRYWHGPADDTPDGMERPSKFDSENYPNGHKHLFSFDAQQLEKVNAVIVVHDLVCPECGQNV